MARREVRRGRLPLRRALRRDPHALAQASAQLDDLKGLKLRTTGAWAEIASTLGASTVILAGGEVYPALERGVVDAIEWATPGINYPLVIILIVVPLTTPLVTAAGFDAVWFCVLFLVMLQTAYLTSIFYLRGIAPPEITLHHM